MQICALRDAFLRKEARTGRQMDQDLHGKMVADALFDPFFTSAGVSNDAVDIRFACFSSRLSGGAEKLANHRSDRHHGRFRITSPLRRSVSQVPRKIHVLSGQFSYL